MGEPTASYFRDLEQSEHNWWSFFRFLKLVVIRTKGREVVALSGLQTSSSEGFQTSILPVGPISSMGIWTMWVEKGQTKSRGRCVSRMYCVTAKVQDCPLWHQLWGRAGGGRPQMSQSDPWACWFGKLRGPGLGLTHSCALNRTWHQGRADETLC